MYIYVHMHVCMIIYAVHVKGHHVRIYLVTLWRAQHGAQVRGTFHRTQNTHRESLMTRTGKSSPELGEKFKEPQL